MADNEPKPTGKTQIMRVDPASLGIPEKPTDVLDLVTHALENAHAKANVLAPITQLEFIPPNHVMAIRAVLFPVGNFVNKSDGNWYEVEGGKIALHGSSLDLLAQAAGISTVDSDLRQVEPNFWTCKYTVKFKGFDGQWIQVVASRHVDLRDRSAEWEALQGGTSPIPAVRNARKFGPQNAESKARNRCIRKALGIKGAYNRADAAKPFVFPVLIWKADMTNPEVAKMVAATELGIVDQVYGAKAPRAVVVQTIVAEDDDDSDDEAPARREPVSEARQIQQTLDAKFEEVSRREPERVEARREEPARDAAKAGPPCECAVCGKGVSEAQYRYSLEKHGRPLCWDDQRKDGK